MPPVGVEPTILVSERVDDISCLRLCGCCDPLLGTYSYKYILVSLESRTIRFYINFFRNSTEQSLSCVADSCSASIRVPSLLRNLACYYHIYMSLAVVPTLS
jgi:hypothetical protein